MSQAKKKPDIQMSPSGAVRMPKGIPLWEIEKLKPYERNARTHSQEQVEELAALMLEFGFTQPILIDTKDGIIAGHGRLMAANYLGLRKVPVIVIDYFTSEQKRAYILADNQMALKAGWDEDLLAQELKALKKNSDGLEEMLGFNEKQLAKLLAEQPLVALPDSTNSAAPGSTKSVDGAPTPQRDRDAPAPKTPPPVPPGSPDPTKPPEPKAEILNLGTELPGLKEGMWYGVVSDALNVGPGIEAVLYHEIARIQKTTRLNTLAFIIVKEKGL